MENVAQPLAHLEPETLICCWPEQHHQQLHTGHDGIQHSLQHLDTCHQSPKRPHQPSNDKNGVHEAYQVEGPQQPAVWATIVQGG